MTDSAKKEPKKGVLDKIKEVADDKEEQLVILSTFVRLGVMIWAGAILTLNYVEIPGYKQEQKIDPTFIASVFTGVLATFGVQAGNKKNGANGGANISKKRHGISYREGICNSTCTNHKDRTRSCKNST